MSDDSIGQSSTANPALQAVPRPPRCIYVAVTDRCFLPCVHCHMWKHQGVDLTTEDWALIIDRLAAWCAGASLHFVGGEPLMRRDLEEIMARAVGHGFRTAICTNGWLVTPDRAQRLSESGLAYAYVSLDGMRPETVDATRGRAGSFEKAVGALELFSKLPNPRGVVSFILHAKNAAELPELLAYARSRGYLFMFQVLAETLATQKPDPRWWESSPLWPNEPKDQEAVQQSLRTLLEEVERGDLVLNTRAQLEGAREYYRDPSAPLALVCPAGDSECAIDSRGVLRLCFYRDALGSALTSGPLADLWSGAAAQMHRQEIDVCDLSCRLNTSNLSRVP